MAKRIANAGQHYYTNTIVRCEGALAKQQLEPGALSLHRVTKTWRLSLGKPFSTAIDKDKDNVLQCRGTSLEQTTCEFSYSGDQELAES